MDFKEQLANQMENISVDHLVLKLSKTTLKIYLPGEKKHFAEASFVFLTKVSAFYLLCHVSDGKVANEIQKLNLPEETASNFAKGVYCMSTLGKKVNKFTSDIGGARYFSEKMNPDQIIQESCQRLQMYYLPVISSILNIDDNLGKYILDDPDSFKYPLATLALFQKIKENAAYDDILNDPLSKKIFKKEYKTDYRKLLSL